MLSRCVRFLLLVLAVAAGPALGLKHCCGSMRADCHRGASRRRSLGSAATRPGSVDYDATAQPPPDQAADCIVRRRTSRAGRDGQRHCSGISRPAKRRVDSRQIHADFDATPRSGHSRFLRDAVAGHRWSRPPGSRAAATDVRRFAAGTGLPPCPGGPPGGRAVATTAGRADPPAYAACRRWRSAWKRV
jgi:hypothetical protein